jgi:hypothetical protein
MRREVLVDRLHVPVRAGESQRAEDVLEGVVDVRRLFGVDLDRACVCVDAAGVTRGCGRPERRVRVVQRRGEVVERRSEARVEADEFSDVERSTEPVVR